MTVSQNYEEARVGLFYLCGYAIAKMSIEKDMNVQAQYRALWKHSEAAIQILNDLEKNHDR